ncbi:histidine phosphatase family protein [Bradyrhizobium pachyrhizi]|uniref:histidine phosphatase family protein n=1 Tax=Bradyrhizobium pachyrhizi TaxID=280333 RepID=UPI00067B820E|nr:histidine phosphatase family protein [Bradyrhizobium pachyrhizi]
MAKTIHLIRHGHHPLLGHRLCGRMPGVSLDALGRRQMACCAELLHPSPDVIQSSPQLRAQQSAEILSYALGLPVQTATEIDEIDYGRWTGLPFAQLQCDPSWSKWNTQRASSCPPGGETMEALQQRIVAYLERLHNDDCATTIALVSHAETIRAALLYYQGIPLDDFLSIEVDPASISTLTFDGSRTQVMCSSIRVAA